jgi:hypothetical protein
VPVEEAGIRHKSIPQRRLQVAAKGLVAPPVTLIAISKPLVLTPCSSPRDAGSINACATPFHTLIARIA